MPERACLLMVVFALVVLLAGCGGSGFSGSWNFLVYMDGDNNLEPYAIQDLNELEAVGSTGWVNILVLLDRAPGLDSSNGDWTGTRLYLVTRDEDRTTIGSTLLADLGELDMSDPATLRDFVLDCHARYPGAERIVLTLWNHGGGVWPRSQPGGSRGICWDDSTAGGPAWNCLTTDEVAAALAEARTTTGRTLDLIVMDACLTQMLEVAYEWRLEADYLVGSEELSWSNGVDFKAFVNHLAEDPSISVRDYARALVDDYYRTNNALGYDTTYSALDLGRPFDELSAAFQVFAAALCDTADTDSLVTAWGGATSFAYFECKDLYDFAARVASLTTDTALAEVSAALSGAVAGVVVHHRETGDCVGVAHGVSITLPGNGEWLYYDGEDQYARLALAKDTDWDEFIMAFLTYAPDAMVIRLEWNAGDCDVGVREPDGTDYYCRDGLSPNGSFSPNSQYGGAETWSLRKTAHATGTYAALAWSYDYTGLATLCVTFNGDTAEYALPMVPYTGWIVTPADPVTKEPVRVMTPDFESS